MRGEPPRLPAESDATDGNANQATVNALTGSPGLLSAEQQSTATVYIGTAP